MNQQPPKIITHINSSLLTQTLQSPSSYIRAGVFQAQQYFSPFQYSTEDQLIEQINSLGDQINLIEQELSLSKQKKPFNHIISSHHHSLQKLKYHTSKQHNIDKSNKNINKTYKTIKNVPQPKTLPTKHNKYNTIKPNITNFLTKSQQKVSTHNQKHKNKTEIFQQQSQRGHQQQIKRRHNQKGHQDNKKIAPKYNQNLQPSYHKFIDKNITKLVKQLQLEKQVLEPTNTNIKKPVIIEKKKPKNIKNPLNQTTSFNHSLILDESLSNSRQKMNQTLCSALFQNSRVMQQRKQQKIQKYRQQQIQKELLQTTFQPATFTSNYRSKNQFVSQKRNLRNFIKRQQADRQLRRKNHHKQLKQVMQECSFKPRLNVISKHSSSIVKEIWNPSSLQKKSINQSLQKRSIQKLQKYQPSVHNLSIQQRRSIDNSFRNSKRSTLFNQSTQISVQDCKELSFLLK